MDNETVINPELLENTGSCIETGMMFCGNYKIKRRLMVSSGEADLYLCENNSKEYVLKLYQRNIAVKSGVTETLKKLDSKHVAKICETGTYNGVTYEIFPYYRNGSLKGHTFSFNELKEFIIPDINTALNELHSAGIIHKDLKPSNLMITDDGKSIAVIDFGISSVMNEGSTILLTRTGMTPEYSAPETFRNVFLEESDYYSFGITIYELFCGHTPYYGMSADEIARYMAVQNIPFPDNMPDSLRELISALTYNDITYRNIPENPNRRWTYKEVEKWCRGKIQPLPGSSGAFSAKMHFYTFCGERYSDIYSLSAALAQNFDEGIRHLSSGLLSEYFKGVDSDIAVICLEYEKTVNQNADKEDVFYSFLRKINPNIPFFFWKNKFFRSLSELAENILSDPYDSIWEEIAKRHLISDFAGRINADIPIENVYQLESSFAVSHNPVTLCIAAYAVSEKKQFCFRGKIFETFSSFAEYSFNLARNDFENFKSFVSELMTDKNNFIPQAEAWFNSIGLQENLNVWKKRQEAE